MREALGGCGWRRPAQPGEVGETSGKQVCVPGGGWCAEPFSRGDSIREGSEAGLPVCRGETRRRELGLSGEREAGHPVWPLERIEGSGALA